MRILFLARSLGMGGAERQLVALARGLRRAGHEVAVAVFYAGGEFEGELALDGVPVHDLGKRGRWDAVGFLMRLGRVVRRLRPDVLHSYLDSPNLVAAALKPLFPSVKVVWGLRSATHALGSHPIGTGTERAASRLVDWIITNSEAGAARARTLRFGGRGLTVVPNGIDTERFRPDAAGRARLRREWRILEDQRLVGLVARLDPVKNHGNFLRAAALVAEARPDVRFACLGGGAPSYQGELRALADGLGLSSRLAWLGERRVTSAEYSALDLAVLASDEGESFPNVLAEAMACGRPVVATDTGDARAIVGDAGLVVPPRDPAALGRAVLQLLDRMDQPSSGLPALARERIEGEYSVEALVRRTVAVLERVIGGT